MPNSKNMKNKNTTTEPKSGSDIINVETSRFMLGIALIDFSGRKTLNVLKALKFGTLGTRSTIPIIATIKSSTFQASLKYEFLCTTNPIAIILVMASIMNIAPNV